MVRISYGEISYRLPLNFLYCIHSDVEKIQSGIGDKVAIFLQSSTNFIASFVIAIVFSWKLALAVSVVVPILAAMATLLTKVIK